MFLAPSLPPSAANLRTCVPNCLRYSSNSYMCDSFVSPTDSYGDRFGVAYGTVTWSQCLVFQALRFLFMLLEYWGIFSCEEGSTKCLLKNLRTLVRKEDCSAHQPPVDIGTVQMFTKVMPLSQSMKIKICKHVLLFLLVFFLQYLTTGSTEERSKCFIKRSHHFSAIMESIFRKMWSIYVHICPWRPKSLP